jgi:thiamine phosphate synthase YjbQ (UPF0047 family)
MLCVSTASPAPAALCAAPLQRARRRPLRHAGAARAALTFRNTEVGVDTSTAQLERGIGLVDITQLVRDAAAASGVRNGVVTVRSCHTTTAVCVNENETRLFSDVQAFLLQLAPPLPTSQYKHNDIALRCVLPRCPLWLARQERPSRVLGCGTHQTETLTSHACARSEPPPGWTAGADAWRAQEPINAHAHLMSMLLGSSESLPLVNGVLQIGTWQSLLLLELDGPRQRRVGVHVMGE